MKYLYKLTVKELIELVEKDLCLKDWVIWNAKLEKRYESAQSDDRYIKIEKQAEEKRIKHNPQEPISWFDSLTMLYYSLIDIEEELKDNLLILQEFCMPYSMKRADYLLVYDNKILILEFSYNNTEDEQRYEYKLQQASGYKEILGVFLPKEIDIGTYTFIIKAEENKDGSPKRIKGTDYRINQFKIKELATVISKFFRKNIRLASNSLERLDYGDEDEQASR